MTRSQTIFSALLCSVSFISLSVAAVAAPSSVTDWHVAPVLSAGQNTAPYCALATNYPDAGVIVTHARNKHGTGTIAFDFQHGEFEAKQYYGVEISFDNMTRTFAAEARNSHLLVIEMAEDHPLYGALNAGQDLTITVQNGGPSVTLAGNSRPFFQLNYCVQALNDDAAAEVIVQRPNASPSFGLQQPATGLIDALRPAAIAPAIPVARITPPPAAPKVAQAAAPAQDGDESRAGLENMLDTARSKTSETAKPARQKLSGISSNDEIDPNTIAPINRNARQSLLFDDPTAANGYVPPRLTDTQSPTEPAAKAPAKPAAIAKKPAAPKAAAKIAAPAPAPVKASPAKPAPVKAAAAKVEPKPVLAKETAPKTVAAKTPALPEALPLPDDAAPVAAMAAPKVDSLGSTSADLTNTALPAPVKEKTPPIVIKENVSRTVLASDYAKEKELGVPAKAYNPADATAKVVKKVDDKTTAKPVLAAAAVPLAITWDDAPVTKAPDDKANIDAMISSVTSKEKPAPVVSDAATAPKATVIMGQHAEEKAAAEKTVTPSAKMPPVPALTAAPKATAKAAPKTSAAATIARAEQTNIPAPALPPAIVEEEVIAKPVLGPMKRANEVVNVSFPDQDDEEDANAPLPQATPVVNKKVDSDTIAVPAAMLQKISSAPMSFSPPASTTSTPWNISKAGETTGEGGYCVMKNHFANQQNLFMSRAADGSATLGIDYGMDLLQINRDYKTTVQLDNLFTEDFIGQARQANLLVVQMGRKDSFFDALRQARSLHVEMDGGASTFDVTGVAEKFPAFNACMVSQGGSALMDRNALPPVVAAPTAAIAPAPAIAAPAVKPTVVVTPPPVATTPQAAVTNSALPAPRTNAQIKAATSGVPSYSATPFVPSAPAKATASAAVIAAPVATTIETPAPAAKPAEPANVALSLDLSKINAALKQANIQSVVRMDGQVYKWGGSIDPIQGELHEQRFAAGKADLLEAVMRDIDSAEKACGGQFTSEIGIPEQHGDMESLAAESSCTKNNDTIVQASLYQRLGQIFRVWIQQSPQANRDILINQRDRLANVLQNDKNFQ